jgi:hypothetical protein
MSSHVLTLGFLRPGPNDHWLNRLIATPVVSRHPFCHVELFFENQGQAFSIVWGERACLKAKSLANPQYCLISICASAGEYDKTLQFCRTLSTQGITFDDWSMTRSLCTFACLERNSQEVGSSFCSKLIAEALQFGGVSEVEDLAPASATPSRLYECFRNSPRRVCNSVPYKRQALLMNSCL